MAGFAWLVDAVPDEPPLAADDTIAVGRDELDDGGAVVVDVLGNDLDPEGAPLTLVSVGSPSAGEVSIVDGLVVFVAPDEWIGTVSFPYTVADPAGQQSRAVVTITVLEELEKRLGFKTLEWDPAGFDVVGSIDGGDVLLGSVFQSLHVLRVPLALLGSAVLWSLVLGGALNVGLVLRRGLPAVLGRRRQMMAIVMAAQGAKIEALERPGGGEPVWKFLATDVRIPATGKVETHDGEEWAQVVLPEGGKGWVPAANLTEHVDHSHVADDREAGEVVDGFLRALRRRDEFSEHVSRHGLWVAHHDAPVHYPADRIPGLGDDGEVLVWKGRNPAYPDFRGTFDFAVAASVLEAHDHPGMQFRLDETTVPSTQIPVEFTNLHFASIGADLQGRDRLDQTAWLVMLAYEDGEPKVIGLCKEG